MKMRSKQNYLNQFQETFRSVKMAKWTNFVSIHNSVGP